MDLSPVGANPETTAALKVAIRITERLNEIVNPSTGAVAHGAGFEVRDTAIEVPLRELAAYIDAHAPEGYAFALYLFQTGISNGNVFYISNAQRPDIIQAMKNWLRRQIQ